MSTVFVNCNPHPLARGEDPSKVSRRCRVCGHDVLTLNDANFSVCDKCGVEQGRALPVDDATEYRTFGEDKDEDEAKKRVERDNRFEKHAEATEGLNKAAKDRFHPGRRHLNNLYTDQPARGQAALTFDELRLATARMRLAAEEHGRRRKGDETETEWGGSAVSWAIYLTRDIAARRGGGAEAWSVPDVWMVTGWDEDVLHAQLAAAKSEVYATYESIGHATGVGSGHRDAARAVASDARRKLRLDVLPKSGEHRAAQLAYLDEVLRSRGAPGLHARVLARRRPVHVPEQYKVLGRAARVMAARGMLRSQAPKLTPTPQFVASCVTVDASRPKALVVEDLDDDEPPRVYKFHPPKRAAPASFREPSVTETSESEAEPDEQPTGEDTVVDDLDDDEWDDPEPAGAFDPHAEPSVEEIQAQLAREMSVVAQHDARVAPAAGSGLDAEDEEALPTQTEAQLYAERLAYYTAKGMRLADAEWFADNVDPNEGDAPSRLVAPPPTLKVAGKHATFRQLLSTEHGRKLENVRAWKEAREQEAALAAAREAKRLADEAEAKRKQQEKAAAKAQRETDKEAEAAAVAQRKEERRDGVYERQKALLAKTGGCAIRQDVANPLKLRFSSEIAKPERVSRAMTPDQRAAKQALKRASAKLTKAARCAAAGSVDVRWFQCDECDEWRVLPFTSRWPTNEERWRCCDTPECAFVCGVAVDYSEYE
ncbi:MAG: hypothetical protein ACKVI4_16730 [Actinomycetales bacterium]